MLVFPALCYNTYKNTFLQVFANQLKRKNEIFQVFRHKRFESYLGCFTFTLINLKMHLIGCEWGNLENNNQTMRRKELPAELADRIVIWAL